MRNTDNGSNILGWPLLNLYQNYNAAPPDTEFSRERQKKKKKD